uniref:Peroxiredoxin n=1 Tax=Candidatus Kentrum sp. DK TaxID=2126562 RepID=A0A450RXG3_9GAMM|nr:MAG: Peroxiredoxin [Candidatus Kentron sp. DK]VFJ49658.1 MAG: Peroxiredoxin [Candidatus Kentron sp. DK]
MAETPSTMLELGTSAPDFSLPDTGGNLVSLQDFKDASGLLVVFLCNQCPYARHIRAGLVEFAREYQPKGIAIVAINANDVEGYPEEGPEKMAEEAENSGYTFPYVSDQTQEVAKAYRAACTPDFFLFNKKRKLVYRGQFDDSRPKNNLPVTGQDLRAAADALLSGKTADSDQKPSFGCNIKWKIGNEPNYFKSIRLKPSIGRETEVKVPYENESFLPEQKETDTDTLTEEQLEWVVDSICAYIDERLPEEDPDKPPPIDGEELQKRIARLEKELRSQRESTKKEFGRFDAVNRRLEELTDRIGRLSLLSLGATVIVGLIVILVLKF